MTTFRTSPQTAGRASASDIARIKKMQQGRKSFDKNILARVYQDMPQRDLFPEQDIDDLIADANGFVEKVVDFASYKGQGFNPDVRQDILYMDHVRSEGGTEVRKSSFHYLMPNGNLHGMVVENNRQKQTEEPIGKWSLTRPTKTAQYKRSNNLYFAEYGGESHEIGWSDRFQNATGLESWTYASVVDKTALDPNMRIPLTMVQNTWEETGNVFEIQGRFFAHRNFAGVLTLEGANGQQLSHFVMNVDPTTVTKNREEYITKVEAWANLSADERRFAFRDRTSREGRLRPRKPFEAYIINASSVIDGTHGSVVELQKKGKGFVQLNKI